MKFSNIDCDHINENIVENVLAYVEKRALKVKFDGLTLKDYDHEQVQHMLTAPENELALFYSKPEISSYNLHNLDFSIGFKHHIIMDAYIANKQDILSKKTRTIKLKSKSNSMQIQYSDEKNIISNQNDSVQE